MKQLIAVDGNSLMHRAFYALPDMTNTEGVPTGALHGFLSMLLKLVSTPPDYLVVAFDLHGPTFRHEAYDAYKAGRRETPEPLRAQFPELKTLLTEMGITVCECPRYEADDILGTFSRLAEKQGVSTLLVTGDRDALQLINATTHVLMTKKGITDTVEFDEATLNEHYGLAPDRMRDLKALMGDSSDNIPGIPGVGEKTAQKLLKEYGTLDGVLNHAAEIPGKLGEKVRAGEESARKSYWLGTIVTDAPVTVSLEDCAFDPSRMARAKQHLNRLELRAVASRLPKGDEGAEPVQTDAEQPVAVCPIETEEALRRVLEEHREAQTLALDFKSGLSFAFDAEREYRLTCGNDLFSMGIDPDAVLLLMKPFFTDAKRRVLVFDNKALRHRLNGLHIEWTSDVFDAMIADYLLNAIRPAGSLKTLAANRLNREDAGAAALFTLCPQMLSALKDHGMETLYRDMELPLSLVLFDMEQSGFAVDETILRELQRQFGGRIDAISEEIFSLAGERFNILSPKQLGEVLFVKLALPTKKKTKTGFSTDADTLESIADLNPIVPLVLEYRFLTKLKSTFVDGLLEVRDPSDGRVRSRFNQCVTATGRISSTDPNLQNIPVRSELGREIRRAFVPSDGNVLVGADYSQIELRLLANISGDANMIDAFLSGDDFHRRTASEVFHVPLDEVTGEMRSAAKAVNFGIVYGISDFGLSKNLNIPVKTAGEYIRMYFERYPRIREYLTESVAKAKEDGLARTLFGRRRPMPELTSGNFNTRSQGERIAMNMPIQGTAADVIKIAMVRVTRELKRAGLKARLVLQVHDELILDTPRDEAERVSAIVRDCMEHALGLTVPLAAEVKIGSSWYDTK